MISPSCVFCDHVCSAIPEGFVSIANYDPSVVLEIRYAGYHNFIGRPIRGYEEPLCILTRQAAKALSAAQKEFQSMGYSIKAYDCYRPQRAVDNFVEWSNDPTDNLTKTEFYPTLDKSVLFQLGYIAERSGHSRGSTLDLTIIPVPALPEPEYVPGMELYPCTNSVPNRFNDTSIDMGTGYDCFDPLANTNNTDVGMMQRDNRMMLMDVMTRNNFTNYWAEWWHYTLDNEPYLDMYFDFPVQCQESTARVVYLNLLLLLAAVCCSMYLFI